jgi:1,4-alpha-glucan branching enzyme
VLEAPGKQFVYIAGDFTNYEVRDEYQMKKTPDGEMLWLELNGLEAGREYIYQYVVADDLMLIPDPYTEKNRGPME